MDGVFGSDIEKCRIRRNICAYFDSQADRYTHSNPHRYAGTDSDARADTLGNTCRYPRADSIPYTGTHGRTDPDAGQHELWCRAL